MANRDLSLQHETNFSIKGRDKRILLAITFDCNKYLTDRQLGVLIVPEPSLY